MAVRGKKFNEMERFWNSLPGKLKTSLYRRERRLLLSSDELPLFPYNSSRMKTQPKYYLFNDIFVIIQNTLLIEYPLEWIWMQHIISDDMVQQQSSYNM
jgi:hypothetical protein